MSSQTVVGVLVVNLKANTASFQADMRTMPVLAKTAAGGIKQEFDKVDFGEARAGAMLLNEELGTHLPRHLTSLIATLPGVGAAFAAALPVIAVVVLITKIIELVEHVEKAGEAAHKAANEYEAFAMASGHHAAQIEIENLKLQDQLRVLQGKVSVNGPAIAMEEARLKAEELTAQIFKAIESEKELLSKQSVGFWKGLLGDTKTSDIVEIVTQGKEAIAELEHQKGVALQAHDDALVASIQKELNEKRAALQTELETRRNAEDTARVDQLNKALEANKKVADTKVRFQRATRPEADAKEKLEDVQTIKDVNAQHSVRLGLLNSAVLELRAESREEADQLKNAQLHLAIDQERDKLRNAVTIGAGKSILSTGSSSDANGKFVSPEDTKKAADAKAAIDAANALSKAHLYDVGVQAKVNDELDKQRNKWNEIAALTYKDNLAGEEHKIKMQEAAGIITKIQADQQITALYAAGEAKAEKDKNDELAKQLALVQQLDALTTHGTQGSDADKAAYAKALADYQLFLLAKEKAKAASDAKIYKSQEDETAKETAERNRAIGVMESTFNSGVMSILQGNATIGQAAEKMWSGLAANAIMAMLQMAEQELVGLALHESIALTEKELHAKNAFHGAYDATAGIPIIGPVLAPIAGATAFAAVMAFNKGGDVPGFGLGDSVPAMLSPREMVLPSNIADMVRGAANGGNTNGSGSGNTYAPTINAPMASAAEIDARLKGHFDRWARSEARKRYTRTN
jgi:hypothetical protein